MWALLRKGITIHRANGPTSPTPVLRAAVGGDRVTLPDGVVRVRFSTGEVFSDRSVLSTRMELFWCRTVRSSVRRRLVTSEN
jgi:hypothetical protein